MMTSISGEPERLLQFGDRVRIRAGRGTVVAVDLSEQGADDEPRFTVELDDGGTMSIVTGDAELLEAGAASTFAGELLAELEAL